MSDSAKSLRQTLAGSLTLSAAERDHLLGSLTEAHPEWAESIDTFVHSVVEQPLKAGAGVSLSELSQTLPACSAAEALPNSDGLLPRDTDEFHFVGLLGQGAMGVVFEAEELASGRHVAVKLIAAGGVLDEQTRSRFRQEAELAASVTHSHSVFVYGAHDVHGVPAMSMELMGGETLQERRAKVGAVSAEDAQRWLMELVGALEASHSRGVLHRDIKPANCYLSEDDQAKLGDFGLARVLAGGLELTHSGTFLGSPIYASPEQLRGAPLDERSDIYSLGATFYDLLTGQPPHSATTFGDLCAQVHTQTLTPLRTVRPDVSPELADLIELMLSLDPDNRPSSARVLATELSQLLLGRPTLFFRRWLAYWAVDCSLFMLLGVIGFSWSETTAPIDYVMAAFVLYIPVVEGRYGSSLGKRLLGLSIITVRRGRAWLRRSCRSLAGIIWMLVTGGLGEWTAIGNPVAQLLFYLGLVVLYVPYGRQRHRASLVDRWTGTRVLATSLARRQRGARLRTPLPCLREPLKNYSVSGVVARMDSSQLLLGVDSILKRVVWLFVSEERLDLTETDLGELPRLVEQFSDGDDHVAVFERLRGAPLRDTTDDKEPLRWDQGRAWLEQLARSDAPVSRLWITDESKVVTLPFSVTEKDSESGARAVAQAILGNEVSPPADLPTTAGECLNNLLVDNGPAAQLLPTSSLSAEDIPSARLRQALLSACSMLPAAWLATFSESLPFSGNAAQYVVLLSFVAAPILASLIIVMVTGRALSFVLLGLDLRPSAKTSAARSAGPLSRQRWLVRTAVSWALLIAAIACVGAVAWASGGDGQRTVIEMTRSAMVLMIVPVIWSWVSPRQALVDRIVGATVARR